MSNVNSINTQQDKENKNVNTRINELYIYKIHMRSDTRESA